ncbi:MAG: hypothetical protein JNK82_30045 [Myxococcaceae bacterium]|nr:hypothetical protein [Myxococcaceae bacterium]
MGEAQVNPSGGRDVLVVYREELAKAREALKATDVLWSGEPLAAQITEAAKKVRATADALDARIHATFDAVLLQRAGAAFRAAASSLEGLMAQRQHGRRAAPDVQRVLKRVVVHAREIGRMTHESGADHVGAAIEALSHREAWSSAPLDALVQLIDTFYFLSRKRLGDGALPEQLDSLVDRATSTAVVTSLHALKDLARRARSEPTLMRDRFQLDGAMRAPSLHVEERLAAWFKLDDEGRRLLHVAVETFTRRLLDRASAAAQ